MAAQASLALATADHAGGDRAFNTVYGQIPGELAPKLALARRVRARRETSRSHDPCTRPVRATDAAYTAPAQFGLARLAEADGDLDGALDALAAIAPTSRAWDPPPRDIAPACSRRWRPGPAIWPPSMPRRREFALSGNDPYDLAIGRVWVLETALGTVESSGDRSDAEVAGVPATEIDLRRALESTWRAARPAQ